MDDEEMKSTFLRRLQRKKQWKHYSSMFYSLILSQWNKAFRALINSLLTLLNQLGKG